MRIKATIKYNGKAYQGWQKQDNTLTIQGVVEETLTKYLDTETKIYASGRTDTGVHANGQVFHFDIYKEVDIKKMQYSLNRMLPDDIYIKSLEIVDDSFHSRFSMKDKTYTYRIAFKEKDPLEKDNVYVCPFPTDIKLFEECLNLFVGEHNFQNFTSKEDDDKGFRRTIYSIILKHDEVVEVTFLGSGFMRYMIRFIVGCALAVAQGKEDIETIKKSIDAVERSIVSYKAPAKGLTLEKVTY